MPGLTAAHIPVAISYLIEKRLNGGAQHVRGKPKRVF
jgi:hypothetical protein